MNQNQSPRYQEDKQAISNNIFEDIKEAILSGQYPPGEKLPTESQLCERYGVSRVTIRAALDRLRGCGLLHSRRGGGSYVCDPSNATASAIRALLPLAALDKQMRLDMFEFRRIVEVESAGIAAMRGDEEIVHRMRKTVDSMRQATDLDEIARSDLAFHQLIAEATHNQVIMQVYQALKDTYYSLFRQNVNSMGAFGAQDHETLCTLIEIRDVAGAKKQMMEHINEAIRQTEECISKKARQTAERSNQ